MFITKTLRRLRKVSPKQMLIAGVFVASLAGAIGLGIVTKQHTSAASGRDCTSNSVIKCGALTPGELVQHARNNKPADLQAAYNHFGLSTGEYSRFASTAVDGMADMDGNVWVNGQKVMTNAWSIGRTQFSYSQPLKISNTTFYKSMHRDVLNSNLPVMVMFDANGTAEAAIIKACGNPIDGERKKSAGECKTLNMTPVKDKLNTYRFTTTVNLTGFATVEKVVYTFSDGTTVTKTNPSEAVEKTFKAAGTAKVEVHVKLPGNKKKVVSAGTCVKQVPFTAPYYSCIQLTPAVLNDKKTQFRFTVKASAGNGATLKDVDFTLDGNNTTTGVTTKDAQGNIYKEYTFAEDGKKHEVVAKVNFNVAGGVQSDTCKADVTSTKAPECIEKPGSGLPPGHPDCQEYCKPNIPKGDARCEEQVLPAATVLPETGMGNLIGLFAGVSAAGAVAHRVVTSRRNRRD